MGELFALISAGSFSIGSIAIRRGMRTARDNGTFMATFVNMVLFLILIAVLYFCRRMPPLTTIGFSLFLVAGLLTTFSGRSLHYAAIRHLGPSRAISFRMSSPIITVCLAFVFIGERFSLLQCVGTCAIIGGVWVLSKETLKQDGLHVVQDQAPVNPGRAVTSNNSLFVGILFALGSALSFGTGHFFRKWAVMEVPSPYWGMVIGTTAAWVAMVIQAIIKGDLSALCRNNFNGQAPPWLFILTGGLNTIGQMFIYISVFFTAVSTAQVLAASEVLGTFVLSRLFLGSEEPLGWRVIVCGVVICLGVVLMIIG